MYLCVPRLTVLVVKANEFLFKPIIVKNITYSLPIINFVGDL